MSAFSSPSSSSTTATTISTAAADGRKPLLRVLTYNVWFAEMEQKERNRAIFRECKAANPDVICFQEVTASFIYHLKQYNSTVPNSANFSLYNYDCSDPFDGSSFRGYGVMMLVKREILQGFQFFDFPTNMGRKLLVANILLNNSIQVDVGTVHLESLGYPQIRRQQLEICASAMSKKNSILCGDFNFCSWANYRPPHDPLENLVLQETIPDYSDIWLELRPGERGYTFNSEINEMIEQTELMRYDRVMYRVSEGGDLKASQINIIGDRPISTSSSTTATAFSSPVKPTALKALIGKKVVRVFPSDHFGLIADFELK